MLKENVTRDNPAMRFVFYISEGSECGVGLWYHVVW